MLTATSFITAESTEVSASAASRRLPDGKRQSAVDAEASMEGWRLPAVRLKPGTRCGRVIAGLVAFLDLLFLAR